MLVIPNWKSCPYRWQDPANNSATHLQFSSLTFWAVFGPNQCIIYKKQLVATFPNTLWSPPSCSLFIPSICFPLPTSRIVLHCSGIFDLVLELITAVTAAVLGPAPWASCALGAATWVLFILCLALYSKSVLTLSHAGLLSFCRFPGQCSIPCLPLLLGRSVNFKVTIC